MGFWGRQVWSEKEAGISVGEFQHVELAAAHTSLARLKNGMKRKELEAGHVHACDTDRNTPAPTYAAVVGKQRKGKEKAVGNEDVDMMCGGERLEEFFPEYEGLSGYEED